MQYNCTKFGNLAVFNLEGTKKSNYFLVIKNFFFEFEMTDGYPSYQNITSKIIYGYLSAFSQKQNLQSKLSIVQIIKGKLSLLVPGMKTG